MPLLLRRRPSGIDPAALLLVLAGYVLLLAPLYWDFSRGERADGMQGHEPAILAVSALLLFRKRHELMALKFSAVPVFAGATVCFGLALYVFGRAYDLRLSLLSLSVMLMGLVLGFRGFPGLRAAWFAMVFPLFALPLPFELVLSVTGPMKIAVSSVAATWLSWLGYPVGRSGVVMTVGQYQLLVTEACAGLQTMFTLEAMGLLYASLVNQGSAWRNALLALLIVPIAFMANVVRVVVLALVTYHFGDAAGQGFLHGFSGAVLFVAALVMIMLTDTLLGHAFASRRKK